MKPSLLYLCMNDGSDMRINKEIRSIAKEYSIFFLGIGNDNHASFASNYCDEFYLIKGKRKSISTIFKYVGRLVTLIYRNSFKNVHVVNEQLFVLLIPFLFNKRVTLDIFDSMFLKLNKPNNEFYWLKKVIYARTSNIIVTDENRAKLLPSFAQKKTTIIPNVPFRTVYGPKIIKEGVLRICYFGTLLQERGSKFLFDLIEANGDIEVIAAGWIGDSYTQEFLKLPRVRYLGILNQGEVNNFLSKDGDYLLSIYPASNINNIYASPNKIYDAIHTKTPLIINSEIKVSKFVIDKNIGIVIGNDGDTDFFRLGKRLMDRKNSFSFSDDLISEYCWEKYETRLLDLYLMD